MAEAARKAIATRYRLLDYLYTAMYNQNQTGTPTISPLFFMYPEDSNTFDVEQQFFFGDSILVSPVLHVNMTSVTAYLPDDLFYDFETHQLIQGRGQNVVFDNVGYTEIPTHIRGGSIIPMRIRSANTTTELRKRNFTIIVAPGLDGTATGSLYLDDGDSLIQPAITDIKLKYSSNGDFSMNGVFDYDAGVSIEAITVLGAKKPRHIAPSMSYDSTAGTLTHTLNVSLQASLKMSLLEV